MSDDVEQRFKDIWLWCMLEHEVGTLVSGPCLECVAKYAKTGPPVRESAEG